MVASDLGGYFCRDFRVRPGKGGRKPLRSAVSRVDTEGENREAWAKATRSAGVALLPMAAA